jgi:hypothetical protein
MPAAGGHARKLCVARVGEIVERHHEFRGGSFFAANDSGVDLSRCEAVAVNGQQIARTQAEVARCGGTATSVPAGNAPDGITATAGVIDRLHCPWISPPAPAR